MSLVPALLIGALYVGVGVGAAVYRPGDPFWLLFFILGVLLLGSCFGLKATESVAGSAGRDPP